MPLGIFLVMGAAFITAIASVVVGLLVFVAQRLGARDELGTISKQIEVLKELNRESESYRLLNLELSDSVAAFRARQSLRRDMAVFRKVVVVFYASAAVSWFGFYAVANFDLGKSKGLVEYISRYSFIAGLCYVVPQVLVRVVFMLWDRWKRSKQAKDSADDSEEVAPIAPAASGDAEEAA